MRVTGSDYRGLMKRIVIAGGIGAGKSAVGERLRDLGFPSWTPTTSPTTSPSPAARHSRRWWTRSGSASWTPRAHWIASSSPTWCFHDASALRRLNAITHAPIGVEIARRLDGADGEAVSRAIPLYRHEHRAVFSLDAVWSVQVSPETAVRRLIDGRGFSEADARAVWPRR